MAATSHKGIIAYGTISDRQKLEVLSILQERSRSQVVIEMIRSKYFDLFGDAAPEGIISNLTPSGGNPYG